MFSVPRPAPGQVERIAYAAAAVVSLCWLASVLHGLQSGAYNTILSLLRQIWKFGTGSLRFFCTMGVVLIINYNTMNLVKSIGWTGMAIVFGSIGVVLLLIYILYKERTAPADKNK